jgi:hypothetical protein
MLSVWVNPLSSGRTPRRNTSPLLVSTNQYFQSPDEVTQPVLTSDVVRHNLTDVLRVMLTDREKLTITSISLACVVSK